MIRFVSYFVAASVIAASCSGSSEVLPTSTEQVVSTTTAETTTTEAPTETTEELVERLGGAVVRLDVAACDGEYVGAGFLIDEHHIVTVAHNVIDAQLIAATIGDEIAIAEPVGMDVLRDIALLRTDIPMGDVYFELEGSEPVVGQDLILFGFPLGLDLTVTRGIVSNADVELPEEPLLRFVQIDAAANPGNSGGPVVTSEGDLIGILQGGFADFEGLNFATKLTVVERLLGSWIDAPELAAVDCDETEEATAPTVANTTQSTSKPSSTASATTAAPSDSGSEVSIRQYSDRTPNIENLVFFVEVADPDGIKADFGSYGENGSGAMCTEEHEEPNGEATFYFTYICQPTDATIFLHQYEDSRGNTYKTRHTIVDGPATSSSSSTTSTTLSSSTTSTTLSSSTTSTTLDLGPFIFPSGFPSREPAGGTLFVNIEARSPRGVKSIEFRDDDLANPSICVGGTPKIVFDPPYSTIVNETLSCKTSPNLSPGTYRFMFIGRDSEDLKFQIAEYVEIYSS